MLSGNENVLGIGIRIEGGIEGGIRSGSGIGSEDDLRSGGGPVSSIHGAVGAAAAGTDDLDAHSDAIDDSASAFQSAGSVEAHGSTDVPV